MRKLFRVYACLIGLLALVCVPNMAHSQAGATASAVTTALGETDDRPAQIDPLASSAHAADSHPFGNWAMPGDGRMPRLHSHNVPSQNKEGCEPAPVRPITWSPPANLSNNVRYSYAPAVAIDSTGTLHVVWYDNSLSDNLDILYANKAPDQPGWSTPITIANTPGSSFWPTIVIDTANTLHVAWDEGSAILYATKAPGSASWTEPVNLSTSPGTAHRVSLAVDNGGNVHAVWGGEAPGSNEIYYTMRPQGAANWTAPVITASTPGTSFAPALAADTTGALHLVWHDYTPGATDIYYATKPRPDAPWSAAENFSATPGASLYPAIAVDSHGTLHLVWQDSIFGNTGYPFEVLYTQKPLGGAWQKPFVNLSRGSGNAEMPALAVGPGDALHVTWASTNNLKIFYAYRPEPSLGWTAPAIVTPIELGVLYPAPSMAAGSSNVAHVFWSNFASSGGREIFYSTTAPPSVPENHVLVVDETGTAVPGVCIYHNGVPTLVTDDTGVYVPPALSAGDTLLALQLVAEHPTVRDGHTSPDSNGAKWAYRTYLTNIDIAADGSPRIYTVSSLPGRQRLMVRRRNPLVLFNLVVSVEWNAGAAYLQDVYEAMFEASNFLYDVTDGQMTFGRVAIYDNAAYWAAADIQISAKNIVHPHAHVGGLTDFDTSHLIRVGRSWDGNSGNQGNWSEPNGFRTLVHEFGHYGLGLFDEYFGYKKVGDQLADQVDAFCTGPENRPLPSPTSDASIMDYHYSASELADIGRWTSWCQQTAQHQLNHGEADWQTLTRLFGDTSGQNRWDLVTPDVRAGPGNTVRGPEALPAGLPFPSVTIDNKGSDPAPRLLTVGLNGMPYRDGAWVTLYFDGKAMDQGLTDATAGQLCIVGARAQDSLQVVSLDGTLHGEVAVSPDKSDLTVELKPVQQPATQSLPAEPYLRLWPTTSGDQLDGLRLVVTQTLLADNLNYALTGPDSIGPTNSIFYDPTTRDHRVQVSFIPAALTGHARVMGLHAGREIDINADYRLQHTSNTTETNLFSNDGNLRLHLDAGSLTLENVHFLIASPSGPPGPPPAGLDIAGEVYEISASNNVLHLERPAVLTFHYDPAAGSTFANLGIYRWDFEAGWQPLEGEFHEDHKEFVTTIKNLGIYALMGTPATSALGLRARPTAETQPHIIYLPIVKRISPCQG